jgi:hypothetical protein
MNRVPLRETGRRPTVDGLERRVNLLTVLVVIQIVLLAVLLVTRMLPVFPAENGLERSAAGNAQPDMSDVEPVVPTEERGDLPPEVAPERPVRVEILNGCGVPKLAAKYADLLRSRGYDVRDTRNADSHNYQETLIYDRTDLPGQATRLATVMGVPPGNVIEQPKPSLVDIDLTLILGRDYSTLDLQPEP